MVNSSKPIYLSPPHMSGLEKNYIEEAFKTNWIAPLGPNVTAFENEFAHFVGISGAVALSSGTAGLHLALRLAGVDENDIVFCSTLTFVATANAVLYLNAVPVFIDSEPNSWNMSPHSLLQAFQDAEKMGRLPKAVIIVNVYGQSADMEALLTICDHYGVPVIEDAAESLGATYKGKASGTLGKFGIFSFNGNKIITTSGGGMLVSEDLNALDKARFWATQARDSAGHYQHSEMGYNYRLSNVLAGIGRGQLKVLHDRVKVRRAIYDRYKKELANVEGIEFMPEASFGKSTRWLTVMTVDQDKCGKTPLDIIDALAKENIESRKAWKPLHMQPLFYKSIFYPHEKGKSFSEKLFEIGVCLPSGSNLTEHEQLHVIKCLKKCFDPQ